MQALPEGLMFRRWPGTDPRFGPGAAELVDAVWCSRGPRLTTTRRELLIPSGAATLQLCLGRPGRRRVGAGPLRRNADVVLPVRAEPVLLEQPPGWSEYWGVQLHPWALAALWPRAVGAGAVAVDALCGDGAAARLHIVLAEPDPAAGTTDADDDVRAVALARWLLDRARPLDRDALLVRRAVDWSDRPSPSPGVVELAAHCGVSPSTLGRAFRRVVGLAPKEFLAIRRFARFARTVVAPGTDDHGTLSVLSGYYDQAHAIRDFRRFTGSTPGAFRHRLNGIAQLLGSAPEKDPGGITRPPATRRR